MADSNQHSEPLASGSVATDSGSTGGGAYSEPLADATYFGDGHAFTVSGDPEQLDKMAAYISELKRERAGLIEQLEAHRTFVDHFLRWCETVAAEEDNPIHLLVREAEALNPASESLSLDQADADLAAGRARSASEVFAEIEAEQNQESIPKEDS